MTDINNSYFQKVVRMSSPDQIGDINGMWFEGKFQAVAMGDISATTQSIIEVKGDHTSQASKFSVILGPTSDNPGGFTIGEYYNLRGELPKNGLKAELMTRAKYDVSGGLMADKDHTCVRLMYRANFSCKLTYGKTYAIEGFLVGAKRHEMPFIMFNINNTREVPTTHAGGETRVHSLGVIVQTLHSKSSLGLQGPISLIIRHDGVDENDPENDSMLVNYVVPSKIIPDDEVILLSAGKRVLFRGTLAGWNRELDMMRVEVTSGDLDIQDEESYSD
ncbi:hypothetical protein PtB15_4B633 [Puccinia triticina]|nr:hypothetical protein PtB15_4B633 [Puccinia triticina]